MMTMVTLLACGMPSLLPLFGPTPTPTGPAFLHPPPTGTAAPSFDQSKLGGVEGDITYCMAGGQELKLDVYYPTLIEGAWQAVVFIHGGGWVGGDKSEARATFLFQDMLRANFLVVSVNYRLAPEHKFPAQIEDVKCAIRFLRANASRFNLDPNRIAAMGNSAGGHLAALLGTTDPSAGFEGNGGYPEQSSRVQGVVTISAPIDYTLDCTEENVRLLQGVFGVSSCEERALVAFADPSTYITPDDPPFLILHGDRDPQVPVMHALYFYNKLQNVSVPSILYVILGGGHGLSRRAETSPTPDELQEIMLRFLSIVLQ